jgi:hypothetical protein
MRQPAGIMVRPVQHWERNHPPRFRLRRRWYTLRDPLMRPRHIEVVDQFLQDPDLREASYGVICDPKRCSASFGTNDLRVMGSNLKWQ